jgi:hypothetical protein
VIEIRQSQATGRNRLIREDSRPKGRNAQWLRANSTVGSVILIGGAGLVDFRVRVAQGHLRHDLLPSFWSTVGISTGRGLMTVPLWSPRDPSSVPATNAIHDVRFAEFDDPERYPNLAAIQFVDKSETIASRARRIAQQRSAIDLPSMLLVWLGFVWGAGNRQNPLLQNVGLPASVFVQTAFAVSGIELCPGLASASSCPEAIWQSALWWHDYYEKTAAVSSSDKTPAKPAARGAGPRSIVPTGAYVLRQKAAAVTYESKPR